MSAKPSKVPRFGATAPGTLTGSIIEPSETKKTAGFVSVERPPVQIIMWLFELIYEWLQYLSDGAFAGNTSVAGTFTQTGGGATTLSGTLGVIGAVTVGTNQTVKVQGASGKFQFDLLTTNLPIPVDANSSTIATNLEIASGAIFRVPISLPQGAVINSAKFRCLIRSSSSVTFAFVKYTDIGETTTTFTSASSPPGVTTHSTLTGTLAAGIGTATGGVPVATSESYYLTLTCTAGNVGIVAAEISYAQG